LLPFIVVVGLAAVKVGRTRARELAMVAILLFLVRAGMVEWAFVSQQPHLAKMEASFNSLPRDARVLPLVDWAAGAPQIERQFWAYGVIERGWYSPILFHDPGVQPFQIRLDAYNPYGNAFGDIKSVDWNRVKADYDGVWMYGLPQFSSPLSQQGKVVFDAEKLQVFQLRDAP
jgi:hypothetical protein